MRYTVQESFIAKDYSGSKINYGLESRDKGSEHEGRASGLEERPGEVTKAWRVLKTNFTSVPHWTWAVPISIH